MYVHRRKATPENIFWIAFILSLVITVEHEVILHPNIQILRSQGNTISFLYAACMLRLSSVFFTFCDVGTDVTCVLLGHSNVSSITLINIGHPREGNGRILLPGRGICRKPLGLPNFQSYSLPRTNNQCLA